MLLTVNSVFLIMNPNFTYFKWMLLAYTTVLQPIRVNYVFLQLGATESLYIFLRRVNSFVDIEFSFYLDE